MGAGKLDLLVLGFGAVGIIKSFHLERSGKAAVTALARSNAEACKRGIRIESGNPAVGTIDAWKPTRVISSPKEAASQSYDAILVSAKSLPDVKPTSETLKPFIPTSSGGKTPAIVLLQNGIGIEKEVQEAFPHAPVLSAAIYTTTNAHDKEPYTVVNGALNKTVLGLYRGEPDEDSIISADQKKKGQAMLTTLAEILNEGGWKTEVSENILATRYSKNLWNCSWGVVNAIARAPGVMSSINDVNKQWTVPLVEALLDELFILARAMNLDESVLPAKLKQTTLDITLKNKFPASFKPSIQVDIENCKPFEVEPIVGYLANKADSLCLNLPYLKMTYNILKIQQNFTTAALRES